MVYKMNFKQLQITKETISILEKNHITSPTKIQEDAIPIILKGKNVIAKSQTGTGKTLAFLLPIMQKIDINGEYPQCIILTPTRELANQIFEVTQEFGGLSITSINLIGGHNIDAQENRVNKSHIIIATPGRLLEHINKGNIYLKNVEKIVIDEADQMMVFDFLEDIELIVSKMPKNQQIMLFSATMPTKVVALSKKIIKNPQTININNLEEVNDNVYQIFINTKDTLKYKALKITLKELNPFLCIIFCSSKKNADNLYEKMSLEGYSCDIIHGDYSQKKREQVLDKFKNMKIVYLITTDLSARGFDIEGITHVINYDLPTHSVYYIHRIGRTGRVDNKGIAVSIINNRDKFKADKIRQKIKNNYININYNNDDEESAFIKKMGTIKKTYTL